MLIIDHLGQKNSLPPVPMSRESANDIMSVAKAGGIITIDRMEDSSVARDLRPYIDLANHSAIVVKLGIEGKDLGACIVLAEGSSVFTSEHASLASFLREPFSIAMSNALRFEELARLKDLLDAENRELSRELRGLSVAEIIGAEYGLKETMEMVRQVAPLDSPVVLLRETGVGKEVIANVIHHTSSRRGGPLVKVNCGAIPETLIDSELFGHQKGAFTGAVSQKIGRFERAEGGTIFLDEIGELQPQVQVRLLRVLQEKQIERVGDPPYVLCVALLPPWLGSLPDALPSSHRYLLKYLIQLGKFLFGTLQS